MALIIKPFFVTIKPKHQKHHDDDVRQKRWQDHRAAAYAPCICDDGALQRRQTRPSEKAQAYRGAPRLASSFRARRRHNPVKNHYHYYY